MTGEKPNDELAEVHVSSGVNERGEGFCVISAVSAGRRLWLGQLTPAEVRAMALDWLGAAEAAEADGALYRALRRHELPDDVIGMILAGIRAERATS